MKIVNLFLTVFLLIAVSCDKEGTLLNCCDFEISYNKQYSLADRWVLVGIVTSRPVKVECAEGVGGFISFKTDSTFSGAFSCNAMGGDYKLKNKNELEIISVFQTLRGCAGTESAYWEGKFSDELRKAASFIIEGNKLEITTSSKSKLVFRVFE